MFNKTILIGNLTKDVELRYTTGGTAVATLRLASSTKYKSGDGMKEETLFIDCSVWGKQADTAKQFLHKGSSILVEGRLHERRWEKDGQQKSKIEIVAQTVKFLNTRSKGTDNGGNEEIVPGEITETQPF
ncbi:MAG: single-stranded DNA-binding protein [Thermodesulfovibrionales bacterium]